MKLSSTLGILVFVAVIILVVIALFATGRLATTPTQTPTATQTAVVTTNSITVANQFVTNLLVVGKASLTAGGYVVIHEATPEGTPGGVIGNTDYLGAGNYNNLFITITKKVKDRDTLFAMFHDDDGDKTYGFPDEDLPLKDAAGKIILAKFSNIIPPP